jgi:MHS family proline/betaine transporter-like MFS transporter
MVWSGGFYLSFVWMAVYMADLIRPPVTAAFGVNCLSLLLICLWFPLAGLLSDWFGRKRIMTIGGIAFGGLGPIMIWIIGHRGGGPNNMWIAFSCQNVLGISLALWGAPMCAWLVEAFEPKARLTSVSIGYNVAQALAGGMSPFVATLLVDEVGIGAPGFLLLAMAILSLTGLWYVAPQQQQQQHQDPQHHDINNATSVEGVVDESILSLELKEIT